MWCTHDPPEAGQPAPLILKVTPVPPDSVATLRADHEQPGALVAQGGVRFPQMATIAVVALLTVSIVAAVLTLSLNIIGNARAAMVDVEEPPAPTEIKD